jgi:hypothetical protein
MRWHDGDASPDSGAFAKLDEGVETMPCIEPVTVYPPQRDAWTDLAHLAVVFLSKLVDRPHGGHCGAPVERPTTFIEVRKEERLRKACDSWTSAATAMRNRVEEADRQFSSICRLLTERSKAATETRRLHRSEFDVAKKEGTETCEIERTWHCLITTMNAVHLEEARMLCAIESARSSYVLRLSHPHDDCSDFDRKPWQGYRHRYYPTCAEDDPAALYLGLEEKAVASERALVKAREDLAEREKHIQELSEKVSDSDRTHKDLDAKYQDTLRQLGECEERWRAAEERLKSIEGLAEPPPEQGTAQEAGEQSDKRRRRSS